MPFISLAPNENFNWRWDVSKYSCRLRCWARRWWLFRCQPHRQIHTCMDCNFLLRAGGRTAHMHHMR